MHKLVILIEPPGAENEFEELWPQFLHFAESMPGLVRETTSRVDRLLYGRYNCALLHELYFDSPDALQKGLASPQGRAAGELLQRMTAGRLTLLIAGHMEDELANILKHRGRESGDES